MEITPENCDLDNPDQLAQAAQVAIDGGDVRMGLELLRRACRLSPFRQDLKTALSLALELSLESGAGEAPEEPRPARRPPPPAREREPMAAPAPVRRAERPPAPLPAPAAPSGRRVAFQGAVDRLSHRRPSVAPWIWFSVLTVFVCAGTVAFFLTRYDVPALIQSATIDPKEQQIRQLYDMSGVYLGQQRYDEAIAALEQAMALAPPDPKFLRDRIGEVYYAQGDQLRRQDKFEPAAEAYRKAIEYRADSADLYYDIGWSLHNAARAAADSPGGGRAAAARSQTLYGESEQNLLRAIEIDSRHLRAYHLLALTYVKQGRDELAAEQWIAMLRHAPPSSSEAKMALRRLQELGIDIDRVQQELRAERDRPARDEAPDDAAGGAQSERDPSAP